ncbi:MAG UNVERIFIED_CONTAM: hypothetical protein LVT10_08460 [Anaerolineae bacterium]
MLDTISPTPQQWDEFVIHQPRSHVLQRAPWGILKSEFGSVSHPNCPSR